MGNHPESAVKLKVNTRKLPDRYNNQYMRATVRWQANDCVGAKSVTRQSASHSLIVRARSKQKIRSERKKATMNDGSLLTL